MMGWTLKKNISPWNRNFPQEPGQNKFAVNEENYSELKLWKGLQIRALEKIIAQYT